MKRFILYALTALLSVPAMAQTASLGNIDAASIRKVEHQDTTEYYITLHANAPKLKNLRKVPRFAILGKENRFYLGIGTNITAVEAYDFGDPMPDVNHFTTSAIPMSPAPGNGAQFRFSAQQSNIYLNVVGLPGAKDQIGAYVSFNFVGDHYNPHLQHAYLKFRNMTAGYTYSIFSDVAAAPATIDYEGPNALTAVKHGMFGYERSFGRKGEWSFGAGIEMPQESFTNSAGTSTVTQRVPDFPFYIQCSYALGNGWIRLSGIVRNLYYRDNIAQKNTDIAGWGVKASGTTPIAGGLTAFYQAVYGRGIASYIQDLTGCGMDLMPAAEGDGRLRPVEAWAAFGSLQYTFSPRCFATATYSHVRTYAGHYTAEGATPWSEGYRYAQYICANFFYNVNSIVQIGAEYLYGRRVDYGGARRHNNRMEAMLRVSF